MTTCLLCSCQHLHCSSAENTACKPFFPISPQVFSVCVNLCNCAKTLGKTALNIACLTRGFSSSLLQSQISPISKAAYRDYLGKLELQYGKLLVSCRKDYKLEKLEMAGNEQLSP